MQHQELYQWRAETNMRCYTLELSLVTRYKEAYFVHSTKNVSRIQRVFNNMGLPPLTRS